MDDYFFTILLGLTVATGAVVVFQLLLEIDDSKRRRLQDRLIMERGDVLEAAYGPIALQGDEVSLPGVVSRIRILKDFSVRLRYAYRSVSLKKFLLLTAVLAAVGFVAAGLYMESMTAGLIGGGMAACLPFLSVNARCGKRQRLIADQLPEALEFLARILRAGHSLATGFQMAGEELPQPLAGEFARCYDEHSLGRTLEQAAKEMANRVGSSDFAFFITAVLIQRQTGGDLAEVLTNISSMIRARIRLKQHVKAITAQGRMVGYTLLVLPIVFFCVLYSLNPQYAGVLLNTPEGTKLLGGAVVMQVLGLLTIRKIVTVEM